MAGYSASFDIFDGISWSGLFSTDSFKSLAKDAFLSFGEIINRVMWGLSEDGRAFSEFHFAAYGIDGYTLIDNLPCNIGKIFRCIGFLCMIVEVVRAGYDSYKSQHSFAAGFLNVNLTITYIADMLGCKRESLSRAMKILQDEKLVKIEGKKVYIKKDELSSYFKST